MKDEKDFALHVAVVHDVFLILHPSSFRVSEVSEKDEG